MRKILTQLLLSLLIIGCADKEWTEDFTTGGFKNGHSSRVKYNIGGKTIFKAQLKSDVFEKLEYPITMTIYLNNEVCNTVVSNEPISVTIARAKCSGILGDGLHIYDVKVTSSNDLDYLSDQNDLRYNTIEGSITYTLESSN